MNEKELKQYIDRIIRYYNASPEEIEKRRQYAKEYRQKNLAKKLDERQSYYLHRKAQLKLNPNMIDTNKVWYENNRERALQTRKEYYLKNKEEIKKRNEKRKEEIKEYRKQYYEQNREKLLEQKKVYYQQKKNKGTTT